MDVYLKLKRHRRTTYRFMYRLLETCVLPSCNGIRPKLICARTSIAAIGDEDSGIIQSCSCKQRPVVVFISSPRTIGNELETKCTLKIPKMIFNVCIRINHCHTLSLFLPILLMSFGIKKFQVSQAVYILQYFIPVVIV